MLQRPQTFWILLAVIAAVCSFEFPIATSKSITGDGEIVHVDAGSSILLILLTAFLVALSSFTMLSYNNLIRQKTLCWLGIFFAVATCLAFVREWRNIPKATLTMTSILPVIPPISLWLAWLGIDRDQKMLKKLSKKI